MGWDKGGRYYTRSKRGNGRVVREYVGGEKGWEAARQDALANAHFVEAGYRYHRVSGGIGAPRQEPPPSGETADCN